MLKKYWLYIDIPYSDSLISSMLDDKISDTEIENPNEQNEISEILNAPDLPYAWIKLQILIDIERIQYLQ